MKTPPPRNNRSSKLFTLSSVVICCMAFSGIACADTSAGLLKKATEEYRAGNYSEAAGHFYATLNTDFSNPTVHYYMASCYVHMNDEESAIREFRITYALAPNSDIGYYANTALKYIRLSSDGTVARSKRTDVKSGSPGGKGSDGRQSGTADKAVATDPSTANGTSNTAISSTAETSSSSSSSSSSSLSGLSSGTTGGTSKSAGLIQSQLQKEKNIRLEHSQKLADEINAQGAERINKTISAAGGSLSADQQERERQMLRLPDDVKAVLGNLKNDYESRRQKQLDAGRSQAAKLDEAAANLQNLIDQHHAVRSEGSNLYVRNYQKNPGGTDNGQPVKTEKSGK